MISLIKHKPTDGSFSRACTRTVWVLLFLLVTLFSMMLVGGCSTTTTETATAQPARTIAQDYLHDALDVAYTLSLVTNVADTLVKSNKLKGQDATNVLTTIVALRDGLRVANLLAQTNSADALSKLVATKAALVGMQSYLTTIEHKT